MNVLWICADQQRYDTLGCYGNPSNVNHRDPLAFATMVRDERHKLTRVHDRDHKHKIICELYDLELDPSETVNQSENPEYADAKTRLLGLMCDRMAETCDPLPLRKSFW